MLGKYLAMAFFISDFFERIKSYREFPCFISLINSVCKLDIWKNIYIYIKINIYELLTELRYFFRAKPFIF